MASLLVDRRLCHWCDLWWYELLAQYY